MTWDWIGFLAGYTTIAAVALFLLDRAHRLSLAKVCDLYEDKTDRMALEILELHEALDEVRKERTP